MSIHERVNRYNRSVDSESSPESPFMMWSAFILSKSHTKCLRWRNPNRRNKNLPTHLVISHQMNYAQALISALIMLVGISFAN